MKINRVGVDLAKHVFQVHGVGSGGSAGVEAAAEASELAAGSGWEDRHIRASSGYVMRPRIWAWTEIGSIAKSDLT